MSAHICNRCKAVVAKPEGCWYCSADLCDACWDEHGHCGHPEAEAQNERARKVPQP